MRIGNERFDVIRVQICRRPNQSVLNPDIDMCITHIRNIWTGELDYERRFLKGHPITQDPPGYVFQTLLAHRRVFERVGLLKEELRTAEDIEWFARARDIGVHLEILPEVLTYRYLHGGNISAQKSSSASERYDDLLEAVAGRMKKLDVDFRN